MKQSKDYQIGERMKESPKIVAVIQENQEITIKALIFFETGSDCNNVTESIVNKLKLRQTSPNVGMLIAEMVGTRKCESRKVTFGIQALNGSVKNIRMYIVDSILECRNKKFEK
ncbi:hypothetical protein X798_07613 [Onchocerca flexuosa]|uniref:DUF1758 domain-containing protein n=1 Tax=Onchocerca flexuosa TaxID=387005 RepID=A0A238BK51_9BILA|nr:hypothetical protein X798_07613 [Onchocerca flexuosa]